MIFCALFISPGAQDEKALQDLLASPHPEKVPDYWRVVYRLVLKGQLNEARKLLSLHPFAHSKPHVSAVLKCKVFLYLNSSRAYHIHMFTI